MENGFCLFCTTQEALEMDSQAAAQPFEAPAEDKVLSLVELATNTVHQLSEARTQIGRDPKNAIQIKDDLYASNNHAFIIYEDRQYWIEDLGSKNGTLVNGAHILDREMLKAADVIRIGHTQFRVE